ncbi:MAG: hypothetical protein ABDH29_03365 [Aquificaceae bacterium]
MLDRASVNLQNFRCKALEEIRRVNEDKKVIVVILDNFASYRSREVRRMAERLGIVLYYYHHIVQTLIR